MKLTTRTRYGVRLLLELAQRYDSGYIQLNDVAKAQNISEKYLEQIVSFLKSAGFVQSLRGAQGGYKLARDPSKINMREVVEKLEGTPFVVDCLESEDCERIASCSARVVWKKLADAMAKTLEGDTLESMVNEGKKMVSNAQYNI